MKNVFWILCVLFVISSCSSDDEGTPTSLGAFENGYWVLNEGPFSNGSGTLSYLNENQSEIQNGVYAQIHSSALGSVLQSAIVDDTNLYLVVNNAHRVVVVNKNTLAQVATITSGLNNPRYMCIANGKGYISNWGDPSVATDDYIAVFNLSTFQIENSIAVSEGPEKMVAYGNRLFVLQQGGWNFNNQVTVLNTQNQEIETTFEVGDVPSSLAQINNTLYVLCEGKPYYADVETENALYAIDMNTLAVNEISNFQNLSAGIDHASQLNYHSGKLYFQGSDGVYSILPNAEASTAELFLQGSFYRSQWIENQFFTLDAGDFSSEGSLKIYDTSGQLENTFSTGIVPTMVVRN